MKKTYTVKAVQRAWIEIEADSELSQQEIYELAAKEAEKGQLKWEETSFNIIDITIDDSVPVRADTKVKLLRAIDPITGYSKKTADKKKKKREQ